MKFLSNRRYEQIEDLIIEGILISEEQQRQLEEAARIIARLEQANLENLRVVQALAATVLLVRANPEADVAEEVEAILREVSDKVALIEEHIQ